MSDQSKTIYLVAGENSGDILGGYLAEAIKTQHPHLCLKGIGGNNMEKAGVEILMDCNQLAVVGLVEILKKFSVIRQAMRMLVNKLKTERPALLILIDYPGFNLRVAKKAKAMGIKVMYYVSPQIWAWRYHRIKTIKENVDYMAVLFPFEEKIYLKENVPVKCVGHPLLEALQPSIGKMDAYHEFQLDADKPIIGLLPGSREAEVKKLLPDMISASKLIKQQIPNAQFALPLAGNLCKKILKPYDLTNIHIIHNNTHNFLQICDAAIVASGTVTLEVAYLQVPLIILYRLNPFTYVIGKLVTNIKRFGLCNIVAECDIAREFLQHQITPEAISEETIKLVNNTAYRDSIKQKLFQLRHDLQTENAARETANVALELIQK
jgi:lipid-A-disaccharide synthase